MASVVKRAGAIVGVGVGVGVVSAVDCVRSVCRPFFMHRVCTCGCGCGECCGLYVERPVGLFKRHIVYVRMWVW